MIYSTYENSKSHGSSLSSKETKPNYLREPYYWFLFIGFFYNTTIAYGIWIFNKIPYVNIVAPYLTPMVIILGILLSGRKMFAKLKYGDLLFIVFVIISVLSSMLVHPETADIINERYLGRIFTTCIPYFLLGLIIKNDDKTFNFLGFVSNISILIGVAYLTYMLNFGNPEAIGSDNMGIAYNYLIVEMLSIIYAFRKRGWIQILFSVIGGVLVISLGTRGPVVLMVAFLLCCVVIEVINNKRKLVLSVVVLSSAIAVIAVYYQKVILFMSDIFSQVGLSTRVLDMLLDESLLQSRERSEIRQLILEKISERPLLGYGIAGEWQFVGWNAHNMYLTFLSNFGVIFGSASLIALAVLTLKAFRKAETKNAKYLIMMFACLVFALGFFSGEPLTMYVFFLIGFATNQLRSKAANALPHMTQ